MKKKLFLLTIPYLSFLLTSCEAHYSGKSFEVTWYGITIPTVIFILTVLIISHLYIISKTYKCPECKNEFKPKWYEISSWLPVDDKRVMRCPKCGRKGFCRRIDD